MLLMPVILPVAIADPEFYRFFHVFPRFSTFFHFLHVFFMFFSIFPRFSGIIGYNMNMTPKNIFLLIILSLSCLTLLTACFGPKKNVYLSPPARTISLDSVTTEVGLPQIKPEADSFLVNFFVPGDSSCPVKIEFKNSQHKLERLLTDSVYSPGYHRILWSRIDKKGGSIQYYRAYYYQFTICDSTYTRSFYYRRELMD